jgi:hypothetical protein
METKETNISPEILHCIFCTITCNRKSEWERHIKTKKHIGNKMEQNGNTIFTTALSCECGKKYYNRSGLWKHKQKCNSVLSDSSVIDKLLKQNDEFKNLISDQNKMFIEQNQEMKKQSIELQRQNQELQKQILEVCKNGIISNTTNNVNSHNKTFNLQVFLNEDCKDAMNITEFVNSIQLQLSDLEHVGQVGYVEGISNIIIKNLKALDVTKRPVHCTDQKRETIYIKDGDVWEKDEDDNKKLRKMIKSVAFRNCKNTRLFKEKYPDCIKSESRYSDIYNKIIIEVMGGGPKSNDIENQNKIMRKIAKEMTIDKSNL